MKIQKSDIVCSAAGRDEGLYFFVIKQEGQFLFLADGKGRKLEKPKRKKEKHVRWVSSSDSRTANKIRCDEKVTNSEIRRALAEFSAEFSEAKGGM